jgi:hypothetical protein
LAYVDWRTLRLPNAITFPLIILGIGFNWISDDEDLDMEIVAQIVKNKDFNALFSSFYSSRESNENKIPDNDTEILNSQAFKNGNKTIQKIVVFYSDNTFSTFDPS